MLQLVSDLTGESLSKLDPTSVLSLECVNSDERWDYSLSEGMLIYSLLVAPFAARFKCLRDAGCHPHVTGLSSCALEDGSVEVAAFFAVPESEMDAVRLVTGLGPDEPLHVRCRLKPDTACGRESTPGTEKP